MSGHVLDIYQWIQSDLLHTYFLLLLSWTYSVLTIPQSVGAYAHIIVVSPRLCFPDVSSAPYYIILIWGKFNKALHAAGL